MIVYTVQCGLCDRIAKVSGNGVKYCPHCQSRVIEIKSFVVKLMNSSELKKAEDVDDDRNS